MRCLISLVVVKIEREKQYNKDNKFHFSAKFSQPLYANKYLYQGEHTRCPNYLLMIVALQQATK
jgi:hypothetical protein